MRHFGIYTNRHKDKNMEVTDRICRYLTGQGLACSLLEKEQPIPEGVDCVLVLGGDGTVLQAARDIGGGRRIPLLGVNLGTLGYLTEVEPESVESALDRVIQGDFELESRMMLNGTVQKADGSKCENWALNDIVINKAGHQQLLQFNLYVNRKLLNKYSADGMIVTTPTGSTGYNLSAGGPIVEPGARLLVVTPICPHTMNQRSVVLSPEDEVILEILAGRENQVQGAAVYFDGNEMQLQTGDTIRIVKSERITELIKLGDVGFLEVLHKKMSDN